MCKEFVGKIELEEVKIECYDRILKFKSPPHTIEIYKEEGYYVIDDELFNIRVRELCQNACIFAYKEYLNVLWDQYVTFAGPMSKEAKELKETLESKIEAIPIAF